MINNEALSLIQLIRKIALYFPYPARAAYWSHESPNFLLNVKELQKHWQLELEYKYFEQEIQDKIKNENLVGLEILSISAKEKIKYFEIRLFLLFGLSLFCVVWMILIILNPTKINVFSSSANWLNFYNLFCFLGMVSSLRSVLRFFNRAFTDVFIQEVNLYYIEKESKQKEYDN